MRMCGLKCCGSLLSELRLSDDIGGNMNLSELMTLADEYAAQNEPTKSILAHLAVGDELRLTEDEKLNLGKVAAFLDMLEMNGVSDAADLLEMVQAAIETA